MNSTEKILSALNAFPNKATILYDPRANETITFQDIIDYVQQQADVLENVKDNIGSLLNEPFVGKTEKQQWQRKGMEEGLKMALEICNEAMGINTEE